MFRIITSNDIDPLGVGKWAVVGESPYAPGIDAKLFVGSLFACCAWKAENV